MLTLCYKVVLQCSTAIVVEDRSLLRGRRGVSQGGRRLPARVCGALGPRNRGRPRRRGRHPRLCARARGPTCPPAASLGWYYTVGFGATVDAWDAKSKTWERGQITEEMMDGRVRVQYGAAYTADAVVNRDAQHLLPEGTKTQEREVPLTKWQASADGAGWIAKTIGEAPATREAEEIASAAAWAAANLLGQAASEVDSVASGDSRTASIGLVITAGNRELLLTAQCGDERSLVLSVDDLVQTCPPAAADQRELVGDAAAACRDCLDHALALVRALPGLLSAFGRHLAARLDHAALQRKLQACHRTSTQLGEAQERAGAPEGQVRHGDHHFAAWLRGWHLTVGKWDNAGSDAAAVDSDIIHALAREAHERVVDHATVLRVYLEDASNAVEQGELRRHSTATRAARLITRRLLKPRKKPTCSAAVETHRTKARSKKQRRKTARGTGGRREGRGGGGGSGLKSKGDGSTLVPAGSDAKKMRRLEPQHATQDGSGGERDGDTELVPVPLLLLQTEQRVGRSTTTSPTRPHLSLILQAHSPVSLCQRLLRGSPLCQSRARASAFR